MAHNFERAPRLSVSDLRSRAQVHPYNIYISTSSFIKGAAITAAAFAFEQILLNSDTKDGQFQRLCLWFAMLSLSIVTFATWSRGVVLTSERISLGDLIFPLILGVLEIAAYIFLTPQYSRGSEWTWWYFIFSAINFCAVIVITVRHGASEFKDGHSSGFDDTVRKYIIPDYRRWLKRDRTVALSIGALSLVIGLLTFFGMFRSIRYQLIISAAASAALIKGSFEAARQYGLLMQKFRSLGSSLQVDGRQDLNQFEDQLAETAKSLSLLADEAVRRRQR